MTPFTSNQQLWAPPEYWSTCAGCKLDYPALSRRSSGWSRTLAWSKRSGEEQGVIGVEQWAEIRRLYFVERRSKRAIRRLTGAHRDTITRAIASDTPPRYERRSRGSKLD